MELVAFWSLWVLSSFCMLAFRQNEIDFLYRPATGIAVTLYTSWRNSISIASAVIIYKSPSVYLQCYRIVCHYGKIATFLTRHVWLLFWTTFHQDWKMLSTLLLWWTLTKQTPLYTEAIIGVIVCAVVLLLVVVVLLIIIICLCR